MEKDRKPFKETKVGNWLKTKFPDILDVAGDLTGIEALSKVGQIIAGDNLISDEDKLEFFRLQVEQEKIELENTNKARDMQIAALNQSDKFSKRFVYYIALFWSVVGAGFIFLVFFVTIPPENQRFVDTILGFLLGTIVATIINYFFGSSSGSAYKSQQLEDMIKRK